MTKRTFRKDLMVALAAVVLAGGCTMKKDEAPPLVGPSELGKSISITALPDILTQDGASQAVLRVTVRNATGAPISGQVLRAEIRVAGQPVDFGTLSARSIVTGSDGNATFSYTAPPAPPVPVDTGMLVDIAVMPIDSGDFNNSQTRTTTIRLVPAGTIQPPSGLQPHYTFSPTGPIEGQAVFFEACNNADLPACAPATNPVVSYAWDFGDGSTTTGQTATHTFWGPGNYFVRLTVTDATGRTASTTRTVAVAQSAAPTVAFVFSPTDPVINQPIHFNASASRAAPARHIVSYRWDFGDGTINTTSGPTTTHQYSLARTYTVTLTVTDDAGRTATASVTITLKSAP